MEYREATEADLEAVVALGRTFRAELYDHRLKENPDQMTALAHTLINDPNGLLLVALSGACLVGMIGVMCYPHHLSGEMFACEVFWYVAREHRGVAGVRLLMRAERWARGRGASKMQVNAPNVEVGGLYERLGYGLVEYAYERSL